MMLAANPSKPGKTAAKTSKKMKSLSRFFKKEEDKKTEVVEAAPRDAASVQLSVTSNSVPSTGKRSSKKRQKIINRFVQTEGSKNKLLWRDNTNGDGDITSEESTSSINFQRSNSQDMQVIYPSHTSDNKTSPISMHKSCPQLLIQEEEEKELQPQVKVPVHKAVRFSQPLIDFKVEIESSWDIFPGPQVDTKDKTKATLLDGYMSMHGVDFRLIGYDREQIVQAQPKVKNYLAPAEVSMLRHQKERLAKYRRQLKKKQRKAREDRCRIKGQLAYEAVEGYKARQDRIIARYKLAAPNAVEHRRRRFIKFSLARAAKVVVQVQQRQNFLFSIRDAAQERLERIRAQYESIPRHPSVKQQLRRMMIHQATMDALMRLQRKGLLLYEVSCEPIIHEMRPHHELEEESDSDESDDDGLDTDDWNFRRLEWAQISFLAAAKSKQFSKRRPVEV